MKKEHLERSIKYSQRVSNLAKHLHIFVGRSFKGIVF